MLGTNRYIRPDMHQAGRVMYLVLGSSVPVPKARPQNCGKLLKPRLPLLPLGVVAVSPSHNGNKCLGYMDNPQPRRIGKVQRLNGGRSRLLRLNRSLGHRRFP